MENKLHHICKINPSRKFTDWTKWSCQFPRESMHFPHYRIQPKQFVSGHSPSIFHHPISWERWFACRQTFSFSQHHIPYHDRQYQDNQKVKLCFPALKHIDLSYQYQFKPPCDQFRNHADLSSLDVMLRTESSSESRNWIGKVNKNETVFSLTYFYKTRGPLLPLSARYLNHKKLCEHHSGWHPRVSVAINGWKLFWYSSCNHRWPISHSFQKHFISIKFDVLT